MHSTGIYGTPSLSVDKDAAVERWVTHNDGDISLVVEDSPDGRNVIYITGSPRDLVAFGRKISEAARRGALDELTAPTKATR